MEGFEKHGDQVTVDGVTLHRLDFRDVVERQEAGGDHCDVGVIGRDGSLVFRKVPDPQDSIGWSLDLVRVEVTERLDEKQAAVIAGQLREMAREAGQPLPDPRAVSAGHAAAELYYQETGKVLPPSPAPERPPTRVPSRGAGRAPSMDR